MLEWENGEITSEPLNVIAADDPVICAIYADENNLLELPGWKRFRTIAKKRKKMSRMANQAKLRSFRAAPKYQYGFEVPRDYNHAVQINKSNKNSKWQEAVTLEMDQPSTSQIIRSTLTYAEIYRARMWKKTAQLCANRMTHAEFSCRILRSVRGPSA